MKANFLQFCQTGNQNKVKIILFFFKTVSFYHAHYSCFSASRALYFPEVKKRRSANTIFLLFWFSPPFITNNQWINGKNNKNAKKLNSHFVLLINHLELFHPPSLTFDITMSSITTDTAKPKTTTATWPLTLWQPTNCRTDSPNLEHLLPVHYRTIYKIVWNHKLKTTLYSYFPSSK